MIQIYYVGLAILHAYYDKELMEERELEQAKVEISSIKHQVKYHQEAWGIKNFKMDLMEIHDEHLKVKEDLVMKEVALYEKYFLFELTFKDVLRWAEKEDNTLEKVEFIHEIEKD
jgi:hypothetical protein